jgi:hypothetical protein
MSAETTTAVCRCCDHPPHAPYECASPSNASGRLSCGCPHDDRHRAAPASPSDPSTGKPPLAELVAREIYDAMRDHDPEGKHRPWVDGGNSLKQDEARTRAKPILATVDAIQRKLEEVSWIAERFVDTDLAHDDPVRAVSIMGEMLTAQGEHAQHGRGDEDGPHDSDCACRGTPAEAACAAAGCGFCRSALDAELASLRARLEAAERPRPRREWHEDFGPVLWWRLPVEEPPYAGTPLDDGFPEYATHWTRIVLPRAPQPSEPHE